MQCVLKSCGLILIGVSVATAADSNGGKTEFYPQLGSYLRKRATEFDQIPVERRTRLKRIATYVTSRIESNEPARLTFICTHNSRRSQMSQIWAATAASFYGIDGVETYSGGTEATAFNRRALSAIERAGLKLEQVEDGTNPSYAISFKDHSQPVVCFSKVYNQTPNPTEDFCAVMTCAQADMNCPIIEGCSLRVAVPYDDPKVADDTPEEAAKYDERCEQICREMLYLFSHIGN